MARLRFPGRPGYRFDRIGVRYSAHEARQTTDPTLAIVARIHKSLQLFRNIFGDSDEDDTEFLGFTPAEVRAAERNLQQVIKEEKQLREQQAQKQKYRFERSRATLASLAAGELELAKKTHGAPENFKKTYKKIVDTGLVKDAGNRIRSKPQPPVTEVTALGKQNGQPLPHQKVCNLKHIALKRLSHNVDTQPVFRRPVGRPRKYNTILDVAGDAQKGSSFESLMAASSVFGAKPISKYTSMARQILARATKQAVHTSNKLLTSTHKVRKFVLPTKSSRSSRVIKPNKRFLEDDSVHQLVAKQPKISPNSPTSITSFKTPFFGMGVSVDKSNSFSAFPSCGLSLSPFNMNREKGFPVFSAAPQPCGTSSFMDGLASQKPLGSLDQPLIVEGKRPRKPSLIMRMKLVEDDPADEIRLQQQLSDATSSVKSSDGQKPPTDSKFSSPQLPTLIKCFGTTKSLIAPAKLFTDSSASSLSSKAFKHQQSLHTSQNTVVLRQAKFQLNRTALNRSKAALARSLKAQLKREAKLERKKRTSQNRLERLSGSTPSSGLSLSQLSPFSKLASDSAIERQKSGLFEGIEAGAGSFSPGSFGSPPVTPSSLSAAKYENKKAEVYQASLIKEESLHADYSPGSKWRCLVCSSLCVIKKNRKLPQVPLCKSCKKSYFFQLNPKSGQLSKRRGKCEGRCNIHFSQKSHLHCVQCKFAKFDAIMKRCRELGIESYKIQKDEKEEPSDEPFSPARKQRHKSEEMTSPESRRCKQKREDSDGATPTRHRHKHKSGDKISELSGLRQSAKSPSHSKEFINASNLDKPLSVDVGHDTDPFSLSPPQTLSSAKSSPDKNSRPPSKKLSLTSNGSDRVSENDDDNDAGKSRGSSRGPRIKHVCRRAAMVFPQQRATFPEEPQKRTLTLSALPNEEKQQLWAKSKQEKIEDSSTEDSNDDMPQTKTMATMASPDKKLLSPKDDKQTEIRKEKKMGFHLDKKTTPYKDEKTTDDVKEMKMSRNKTTDGKAALTIANKMKKKGISSEKETVLALAAKRRGYTRKIRCKECKGCKTPECGVCVFCRDKPKFGGPGRIKKCCKYSVCLAPKIPRKATQAFIEPKSPTKTYRRDDDDQNGDHHTRSHNSATGFRESSSRYQDKRANNHWKMDGSGDGAKDDGDDATEDMDGLISGPSSSSIPNGLDMDGSLFRSKSGPGLSNSKVVRYAKGKYTPAVEATIQLALTDVRNPFLGRMTDTFVSRMKYREKISVPHKQLQVELKPVQNETAYSFDVPLKTHLIRADYEENYDVELAWSHGFSLTLTGPSCVRALCYLCGSAGKHEMLYCIVCCQPYHSFCLDEEERPEDADDEEEGDDGVDDSSHHGSTNSNTISWCCRRCQFCHVCGHQNGLLKCHRCKDTYHPECLGPNYPTRPSHKNIWVCTKCVRCKSCGATTPGVGTNATWTYDFSLCYECGKLMDKGNFCPICHKCYSDDDWESKMVQCAVCESWVHAKCEELTDEMYQLVSFLPEEVQYTCRVCSTDSPHYWERVLKSELVNGLLNVLNGLLGSKCAQMLLDSGPPRDYKKLKQITSRAPDGLRVNLDSSNSETASNKSLNSSTDSADSPQDTRNCLFDSIIDSEHGEQHELISSKLTEQAMHRPTDGPISSYTKHLLTRRDEEIVEKCDCETVRSSSSNQTAASYGRTHGRNLLFTDNLPVLDTDNVSRCSSAESVDNGNNLRRTSNATLSPANVGGLKSVTRKELTTNELEDVTNGDCDSYNNTDSRDITNILLGLVGKQGDLGNPKIHPAVNGDVGAPKDIKKIVQSICEKNNCVSSVCSDVAITVSTPSCITFPTSSSHNLPSVPSLCAQDSRVNSQGSLTQSGSCGEIVPSPISSLTIKPVFLYPDSSRESVSNNLHSNHNSVQNCVQLPELDNVLQSSSNCAFSTSIGNHANVCGNKNMDRVSLEMDSKCDNDRQAHVDSACCGNSAVVLQNGNCFGHLQQQGIPSVTPATPASNLDVQAHRTQREDQENTQEKGQTALQNSATCLHVSFGLTVQQALNQSGEFPRDFNSIRIKIDSGLYSTVEEFSEDMVRIIQTLLFENEQYTTRKKQANSVRSIFIKQMERFFPWFNVNTCKLWEHNRGLPSGMLRDAVLPPSSDHTYAQWLERKNSPMSPQPSPFKRVNCTQRHSILNGESLEICTTERMQHHLVQNEDTRACLLCQQFGDDEADCAGRLLYCGQDDWIHINCALWSAEVFEQDNGSLQNVQEAVSRGKKLRCNLCQLTGATVGCCEVNCRANYHFMCARADKCVFQEDKTIFCRQHSDCVNMNVVKEGHFGISSRVCVNLDKIRAKSWWGKAVDPATLNVIIGSCTVESLGVLQSSLSDTEECLYPVDFRCTRIYWSTQDARRRCVYTCRIVKVEPDMDSPGVKIHDLRVVHDESHPDFVPLDQLNLENLGIPNFFKQSSKTCGLAGDSFDEMDDVVFLGSDLNSMTVTSVSFSSQSVNICTNTQISSNSKQTFDKASLHSDDLGTMQNPMPQSEISEHCFIVDEDDPHGLSKSWPVKSPQHKPKVAEPKPIDLSGLSPSTLALLSITNPSRYLAPQHRPETGRGNGEIPAGAKTLPVIEEEELGLIKIADRLNNAASGRTRQPNGDSDRSILRSPLFPLCSPKQQYSQFRIQTQQSKSQTPSPVHFKPTIRPRSNSEGMMHDNPLSPLLSSGAIPTFMPASLTCPQLSRARSESPLTIIKPRDLAVCGLRSSSLSPPPVTVKSEYSISTTTICFPSPSSLSPLPPNVNPQGSSENSRIEIISLQDKETPKSVSVAPIIEVLENEDEEKMTVEDASKRSNLDPNLPFESLEESNTQQPELVSPDNEERFVNTGPNYNTSGDLISDIISTESLKTILENVPPEVLEGENVKVVVLSDIDDLTEEDLLKLASSVMQDSPTGDQVASTDNVDDGEMGDNDEQQGEESAHESKAEGADSDQSDQGNSSSGTSNSPEEGGSDAGNSDHDKKQSDSTSSTPGNNILSSGHQPYCHLSSADLGLVPTSSSSGDTQEGNGDDDDLRKPHKDEENKKNKDVVFHDVDENLLEKDSESLDTSSEGQSEMVTNSEKLADCQDKDKTCSSEACSRKLTSNISKVESTEASVSSSLIEIPDEKDFSGLVSNDNVNSCSFSIQDKNDECSSLSSNKERFIKSASEKDDFRMSGKIEDSGKTQSAPLPTSETNIRPKEDVITDSTVSVLDDSRIEGDDSADQSFTELSEDDVKIIDLSDSEKAEKLNNLEMVDVRSGKEITQSVEGTDSEMLQGNAADRQHFIQSEEKIAVVGVSANKEASSDCSPLLKAQVSGLISNAKGASKSNQMRPKAGSNVCVSTQDTTTDEESDYLMLDDFSYSETNDEDDCINGETHSVETSTGVALPEVALKEVCQESSQELNQQCTENTTVNNLETQEMLDKHTIQQITSSSVLLVKNGQVKITESQKLHQTPLLPAAKNENWEHVNLGDTEIVSLKTVLSKPPDTSCENSVWKEHQHSSGVFVDNMTQSGSSKSGVKLRDCYVSLCRDAIGSNQECLPNIGCFDAGPSKSQSSGRTRMQLRVRKLSDNDLKKLIAIKALSDVSKTDGGLDRLEVEDTLVNTDSNLDLRNVQESELPSTCGDLSKSDISEQSREVLLLELKPDTLQEKDRKTKHEDTTLQPELLEVKASKNSDNEMEFMEQAEVSSLVYTRPELNLLASKDAADVEENSSAMAPIATSVNKVIDEHGHGSTIETQVCQLDEAISDDPPESLIHEIERSCSEILDHSNEYEDCDVAVEQTDVISQNIPSSRSAPDNINVLDRITPVLNSSVADLKLVKSNEEQPTNTHKKIDTKEVFQQNAECSQENNMENKVKEQAHCGDFLKQNKQAACGVDPEVQRVSEVEGEESAEREKLALHTGEGRIQNLSAVKTSEDNVDTFNDVETDQNSEGGPELSVSLESSSKCDQRSQNSGFLVTSKSYCGRMAPDSDSEEEKELLQIDHTVSTRSDMTPSTKGGGGTNTYSTTVLPGQREGVGSGSDDNLHERIVEKIKAESLARSSPGEKGPFKCPTCKRMYRTRESYEFHVRDCDFEVSTSDDEDKPVVKELRSSKKYEVPNEDRKQTVGSDVEKLNSISSLSPSSVNEPLTIIITDEYKDEKFSPSSRDLSDGCSSVQSQDSRRSSLRKSTATQRNAAPAHLAKARSRDSKQSMSPDGSTCSSLLSPKSSTSRADEKPSPKETMLEAIGLVSRRSLELSPNSDLDRAGALNKAMRLQPRVSPTAMTSAPKREKRSPAHAGNCGIMRPSILAGGLPKPGSSHLKSIAITYDPVIVEEVTLEPFKPKKPRQKRIWWIEASECPDDEAEEKEDMDERDDEESDEEESVACRTRQRATSELKSPTLKKGTLGKTRHRADETNCHALDESNSQVSDGPNNYKIDLLSSYSQESDIQEPCESSIQVSGTSIPQTLDDPAIQESNETNSHITDLRNTSSDGQSTIEENKSTSMCEESISHRRGQTADEVKTFNESNTCLNDEPNANKGGIHNTLSEESNRQQSSGHKIKGKRYPSTERNKLTLRSDSKQVEPAALEKEDDSTRIPHLPKICSSGKLSVLKDDCKEKPQIEYPKEDASSETNAFEGDSNIDVENEATPVLPSSDKVYSVENALPSRNLRSTRSKERKRKDNDDDDNGDDGSEHFQQSEDPLMSPLRRSRRPTSKTAKLSEYLTELKKEKEEAKFQKETCTISFPHETESIPSDLVFKRGRGRPKIFPEKERPKSAEKKVRGHQRKAKPKDEDGQEILGKHRNDVSNVAVIKGEQICDQLQDKSLLEEKESSSKSLKMKKRSHRLQLRSTIASGNTGFETVKDEESIKVQTSLQCQNEQKSVTNQEEQLKVSDRTDWPQIVDNESLARTHSSAIQNVSDTSLKSEINANQTSPKGNPEFRYTTEDHDNELSVQSTDCALEDNIRVSDNESSHNSEAVTELDNCIQIPEVGTSMDTSRTQQSASSFSSEATDKKEDDSNSGPPFSLLAPDKSRQSGQKLRIIIRSPNIAAAQTIGELIKKTALSVNPKTLDITVTTNESCVKQDGDYSAETLGPSEKVTNTNDEGHMKSSLENSNNNEMSDLPGADAMEAARDMDDMTMVSRSGSPDSISAAYDIQSDDFSSETSNDADDFDSSIPNTVDMPLVSFGAMPCAAPSSQPASHSTGAFVSKQKSNPISTSGNVSDDDNDVIIVKAVGLQPPEPGLSLKTSHASYTLLNNPQPKLPISPAHSQQYSNALAVMANTSNSVAVTSCGRILTTPPVLQQSGTISHISQQHVALSPTRQNMHPFINLHHQNSPQQNQPSVMISEVSPGRFIFQQQPNTRQDFLTSQDIGQSGLLLQNPGQPGILIQAPHQSGISIQNATQPGIIFRHTNPTGLMMPPNNSTTILQGQPPILQSTGQSGLSFISLNPSNPLASTILSPIQPLQSHVTPSSILPSSMGLTSLMQTVTLGSQSVMIGQPFIAQPSMFLPQLSSQPIVSQHSDQIDLARRQQQQQLQSSQSHNQQQVVSSVKSSSIIIDPHAHMLSSGLNQTVLKASMQQYSPLKQRPVSTCSGLDQKIQLSAQSFSAMQSCTSPSPALFSLPTTSSSILAQQALNTCPSPSTIAPTLNLQKTNIPAPKLTKVDGAPAQVNYMGSFDLNTSSLQSVINGSQSFNQDASKRIMELVQSALKNQGKEHIPGVEVTTAITNTPQGPKKVLRVFINEDILPTSRSSAPTMAPVDGPSLGALAGPNTSSSAMASLLSLGHANIATSSQTSISSEWTKLLPSSSQTPKSEQYQNLWSTSNTGYVSIPISQNLSTNSRPLSQSSGNSRFLPSAQFRRALKPAVYSHHLKRKHSSTSSTSDSPQAKRPVFEKMLKSDGVFSGTLQHLVERHAFISDPASQKLVGSCMSSGLSKPEDPCSVNTTPSNYTVPSGSSVNNELPATTRTSPLEGDCSNLPTTLADDSTANSTSQELQDLQHSSNHLQHHSYHHIAQEQQQLQRSPHKRASFPLMSPTKKPQAAVALTQSVRCRARKQILQKSVMKKDILQKCGKDARLQLAEKRKTVVKSRRPNTAVVASHHPLIHHKKGSVSLPQPTLEEEVVATPLDLGKGDHPHGLGTKSERERSQSRLRFEITSDDGFSCQGDTVEDAWNQVLEKVQDVRAASRMKQLSYAGISGRTMFGLDHEAVVYLIEQLYGAVHCHRNYKFRFHKYDLDQADEEVALNPTGAARSEFFIGRKPFDMFNFLKSVYRTKPGDDEREKEEEMALKSSRRATSLSLPMAMRFRKLKTFAKEAVDVYRSKIHGRGLFCKRNIDAGEMVIEYAGEVIRASLTDKREKFYEGKGIGCYMFRIDDDEVVDATMHGSAARFINHSCEPNCFSKVILVDGKKHIVIFAMRPIKRGEELTYDYKFPIEEVKIPCSCGSKRCRKYLN